MRTATVIILLTAFGPPSHLHAQTPPPRQGSSIADDRAVIVVTGMKVSGDPEHEQRDLTVAEGAVVRLMTKEGGEQVKPTVAFARRGDSGQQTFHTADFPIELGSTCSITMTFHDGTTVNIPDYSIPRDWKTHLQFHSTNGTKSPASILRYVEDPKTGLRCCVYALHPIESYRQMGGRQVK